MQGSRLKDSVSVKIRTKLVERRGLGPRASLEVALTEMAIFRMVEYEDLESLQHLYIYITVGIKVYLNISQKLGWTFSGRHVSMMHCIS